MHILHICVVPNEIHYTLYGGLGNLSYSEQLSCPQKNSVAYFHVGNPFCFEVTTVILHLQYKWWLIESRKPLVLYLLSLWELGL